MTKQWCPPANRKRPIDLVLLSIGGNDIGFGALALYAVTESARDLAPIASLVGSEIRFGPDVSRAYLAVLDKRIKAVRDALIDGFGVEPARVLQNAYEPIQFDETGSYCGAQPTLGMDVHPSLKVSKARLIEAAEVSLDLQKRLECMASTRNRRDCPAGLATGAGTGFRFITDHVADFSKRGICARDPTRALIDQAAMKMPRRSKVSADFEPYSPAGALPYGHRWRLIHNPNDAFLTANTHREGISMFDILQPAYAALTSGRVPSDRRGPRDRGRPRDAPRAHAARQGEEAAGRGTAELDCALLPRHPRHRLAALQPDEERDRIGDLVDPAFILIALHDAERRHSCGVLLVAFGRNDQRRPWRRRAPARSRSPRFPRA